MKPWEKYAQQPAADAEVPPWEKYAKPAEEPGLLESAAAGLGKGFGSTVLGGQKLVGRGLRAISAAGSQGEGAGQWLMDDADQGRAKLTQELAPYKAANPLTTGVGELAGELVPGVGAAAGVGKLVGKAAPALGQAIATSGMRGGNMATRSAGAGAAVGLGAAMADEDLAGGGALIGAATPGAVKLAGALGTKAAQVIRGPAQSADTAAAVQAARSAGYVIPPTQANQTLVNRVAEGFAGKLTTAQNASAKNAGVTADLASKALGLPAGTKITPDVLDAVRKDAGQQYSAVASSGVVTPGAAYDKALDAIAAPFQKAQQGFPNAKLSPVVELVESLRSQAFDAGAAVEKLKHLRSAADDAFRTGATDIGRASRAAAKALEDALEAHLAQVGSPADLAAFREARKTIAKTYTVQKALNPETGAIDANKLAGQLAKGKPLSGGLETAARFASRFPKANQTVERMGSLPQTSPLDWGLGSITGIATGNPLGMATTLARPAVRGYALSDFAQNRLVQSAPRQGGGVPLSSLMYRTSPLLGAQALDE